MQSVKQVAANMAATATAGLEKTAAAVQEKVERMSAHDQVQKDMATEKKHDRQAQAELHKQEAKAHNASAKQAASAGGHASYTATGTGGAYATPGTGGTHMTHHQAYSHSATEAPGPQAAAHQIPALAGHGTGQPHGGYVEEGVARTHHSGLPADTAHQAYTHSTIGCPGQHAGAHHMPAFVGHGTGQPHGGYEEEGVGTTHHSGLPADTAHQAYNHSTFEPPGQHAGAHHMPALAGHGTGQSHGGYVEETHHSGLPAGTAAMHNARTGGTFGGCRGTGEM